MVRKKPSTIAEAKEAKSKTFYGKGNKELAAVTKEELKESGFKSLRDYLNKQQGKTRRTDAKVAPRPKARPAPAPKAKASASTPKKYVGSDQRPDNRPVKSTPKSKSKKYIPRRGSSAPLSMKSVKGFESSLPSKKDADPYKDVDKGPRGEQKQAAVPTTEQKVAMAELALSALGGPGTIAGKAAIKGAIKFGTPFITKIIKRIKNLKPGQQEDVLQKAARQKMTSKQITETINNATSGSTGLRNTSVNLNNVVTQAAQKAASTSPGKSKPFGDIAKLNAAAAARRTAAKAAREERKKEALSRQVSSSRIPGAKLRKKGGLVKKYNKGGKVYKRKEGGQVMSGNDLVSSIYN